MAEESMVESSMKRQRDEEENGVSLVSTVSMDMEGGNNKDPDGDGNSNISSVIPGWFSEISPMWPG